MKKLALAIAALTITVTPVLACPHMDQASEEAAPPRTAAKEAPKAKEATPTKDAKADKATEKKAEKKTEKKADKVSQR